MTPHLIWLLRMLACSLRIARVPGRRLTFNVDGRLWEGGVANLVAGGTACAWGVVWDLPMSELLRLDAHEVGYVRARLPAQLTPRRLRGFLSLSGDSLSHSRKLQKKREQRKN